MTDTLFKSGAPDGARLRAFSMVNPAQEAETGTALASGARRRPKIFTFDASSNSE